MSVRPATVPLLSNFLSTELGADSASARVLTAYAEATTDPAMAVPCTVLPTSPPPPMGKLPARPRRRPALYGQVTTDRRFEVISDKAFIEPEDGGRNTLAFLVLHRGQVVAGATRPR